MDLLTIMLFAVAFAWFIRLEIQAYKINKTLKAIREYRPIGSETTWS